MLTWINEKAKWVIVIFAAGIAVGLLAMDRVPNQTQSYPVGVINDKKVYYTEFDSRIKMVVQNQYQGQHLEDEQYNQLRTEVFRSFVRQTLLGEMYDNAELKASVAELKAEFKNNPDAVRARLVQEAQQRLYMIQRQATSQEELQQRTQTYIASLPKFLVDTTFNRAEFEAWLETPAAFQWGVMLQYEDDLKNSIIPSRQLQVLVGASVHPTTLESSWNVDRRMTDYELQVAVASKGDFAVDESTIDSATIKGYFNAHKDSFFVAEDLVKLQYAVIPVVATAGDEAKIKEYAMTIYYQLADTSSATNFEDMARISSEDPGSAEKGGLLSEDYIARSAYVKEFSDAAWALDSGAISEPVRSQFGYHIIKSFGKKTDESGVEMVKVAHILLSVNASSETIDSLEKILTGIKSDTDAGKEFVTAAKARNLEVKTSEWIGRNGAIDELGYLKGLSSYCFPNENLREEYGDVSPVLKNNKYVVIANKVASINAGDRNLDLHYNAIKGSLLDAKSEKAAEAYLSSVSGKVKAWAPAKTDSTGAVDSASVSPEIEKVSISVQNASVDGYVPGFGYSNPELAKVIKNQKEGEWGPVLITSQGAVMLKVVSKKSADDEAVQKAVSEDKANANRFTAMSLFNDFVTNIEKATPVVNNLDLFYKD
ncbi:MAG: peptidylprolyl isomerase [Fibrobacteraceae bacterium]|nr:peptidylprolyl isomerase [Fibrobacteraceae bacterium]